VGYHTKIWQKSPQWFHQMAQKCVFFGGMGKNATRPFGHLLRNLTIFETTDVNQCPGIKISKSLCREFCGPKNAILGVFGLGACTTQHTAQIAQFRVTGVISGAS